MLELRFLGGFEVIYNSKSLDLLKSQKGRALLAYLILTETYHSRSALAGMFWPDMPENKARTNLRKAVGLLREMLGPYLSISRENIAFRANAPYQLDVACFEAGLKRKDDIRQLESSIALYKGDLLAGFYLYDAPSFDRWLLTQQARLRELALNGLSSLVDQFGEQGAYQLAIQYARRLLEIEPWREDAHRNLMYYLALDGQRGAALMQYDICLQLLREELSIEPAFETAALYDAIRNNRIAEMADSGERTPVSTRMNKEDSDFEKLIRSAELPPFLRAGESPSITNPWPLVTRDVELTHLNDLLDKTISGKRELVFISGEAGAGKTSLVEMFTHQAQQKYPGLVIAQGSCTVYTGVGDPYLPFRTILAMLLGDVASLWQAGVLSSIQAEKLWRLIPLTTQVLVSQSPELIDMLVPRWLLERQMATAALAQTELTKDLAGLYSKLLERQAQTQSDQGKLFEACAVLFETLSAKYPLLLIMDDLHWADISSISLLSFLGNRLAQSPVMIVGTFRPEDVELGLNGQDHPLKSMLAEWRRQVGEDIIDLDQAESGRAFIDAFVDGTPNNLSETFRQELARLTGGHPLFTVEVLRDLEERSILRRTEGGTLIEAGVDWGTLPVRVEGVIARRTGRLDDELKEVLAVASVQGERFSAEVTAQALGMPVSIIVRRLSNELDRRHRLVHALGVRYTANQRQSTYQFRHNLFQSYVYDSLDEIERVYFHEAVGRALETVFTLQPETIAVELGRHFSKAGDFRKAILYLQMAGDTALRVYAYAEAILHFRRSVDLIRQVDLPADQISLHYTKLGRALELNSEFVEAVDVYIELEALARQTNNLAIELTALAARLTIQSFPSSVQNLDTAIKDGRRALALAREIRDTATEAKILWILSIAYGYSGQVGEAILSGESSLALARELEDPAQLAQTLHDLGTLCYLVGRLPQCIEVLKEAGELWRQMGNLPMLADALSSSCVAHVFSGDYDDAIALSEEARQISESIDNIWGRSYSQWKIGLVHWQRGDCDKAIQAMRMCISLGESANFVPAQTVVNAELAMVFGELGDLAQARELVHKAISIGESSGFYSDRPRILSVLAQLAMKEHKLDEAQAYIEEGRESVFMDRWPTLNTALLIADLELALRREDYQRAKTVSQELLSRIENCNLRHYLPQALHLQARTLLGQGEQQRARNAFLEAKSIAEELNARRMLWLILSELCTLAEGDGEHYQFHMESMGYATYIAEHTGSTELQQLFLRQPEVQKTFG